MTQDTPTKVAIIMGSKSDLLTMRDAGEALRALQVPFEIAVVSAHRTPLEMAEFASGAVARGIRVIIAGAGGAAHLPGMVAAHTPLPVIGVPVPMGHLNGIDALLSIAQMPRGVPVATVSIGGAYNAGLLAAQILAAGGASPDTALLERIRDYKASLRKQVQAMQIEEIHMSSGQ